MVSAAALAGKATTPGLSSPFPDISFTHACGNSDEEPHRQLETIVPASIFPGVRQWLLCLLLIVPASSFATQFVAERLNKGEPIMSAENFRQLGAPEEEGANINGPSVIRIPDWIPPDRRAAASARYYMYFAHHHGDYIRLAWAEKIEGPWQLYHTGAQVALGTRGVLDLGLERSIALPGGYLITEHIASPDVHVDAVNKRIVMYFHGVTRRVDDAQVRQQQTYVATSRWGLEFASHIEPVPLTSSYLRVFEYGGVLSGLTPSAFHQPLNQDAPWSVPASPSINHTDLWTAQPTRFLQVPALTQQRVKRGRHRGLRTRHMGLYLAGNKLHVFFTRKKDAPERILVATVDLREVNWFNAPATLAPEEVLRPQRAWEGAELEPEPSRRGAEMRLANALRDPFVFSEGENLYLFYAGGGEQAIGLAQLTQVP